MAKEMNYFVCEGCGTKYQSTQKEPPPGIYWDDGHTCTPVKLNKNEPEKVEE